MEKLNFLPNGQWELSKGVMNRLAPNPNPLEVRNVGGGSASNYRPIEDAAHKKRAQYMLLKDTIASNPKAVKMINGTPHIMLHRGLNGSNWQPEENNEKSVTHAPTKTNINSGKNEQQYGGNAYTTQHNWAKDHGDDVVSIWVPIHDVHNYSDYTYKMAGQSAHRSKDQDVLDTHQDYSGELDYIPLKHDFKTGKTKFREDVHAYVGPGTFSKVTPKELEASKKHETNKDPTERSFDLKIKPRL